MPKHAETITSETVIDWVMTTYPSTVSVFLHWRMQCVGCPIARFESIADACLMHQRPVGPFLTELRMAAAEVIPEQL